MTSRAFCPVCNSCIGYIGWFFETLFGTGSFHDCEFRRMDEMYDRYDAVLFRVAEAAKKYREAQIKLRNDPNLPIDTVVDLGRTLDRELDVLDKIEKEIDKESHEELPRGPNKTTELPRGSHPG